MAVQRVEELRVWQAAMTLVELIYRATKDFPKEEIYGLTSQVRRAAVSVPANIAEGQGRDSTREFLHHLSIARGSLTELRTEILIAQRLGYIAPANIETLLVQLDEVGQLLSGLQRALRKKLT